MFLDGWVWYIARMLHNAEAFGPFQRGKCVDTGAQALFLFLSPSLFQPLSSFWFINCHACGRKTSAPCVETFVYTIRLNAEAVSARADKCWRKVFTVGSFGELQTVHLRGFQKKFCSVCFSRVQTSTGAERELRVKRLSAKLYNCNLVSQDNFQ